VILCHARRDPETTGLQLSNSGRRITLKVPAAWTKNYPQSAYLLRQEVESWQKMPWVFALS
jgi:exopolyphosphatase/guanosine-5'-triphosphate,3'-diphosphate pyrophosphatase